MMEILALLELMKEVVQIFDWFLLGVFGIALARYYWVKGTSISKY
jgi:hypothetical protein